VAKLTLGEAAKAAGLSKGGILYHFRSKDDLVRGMIERLINRMDEEDLAHYAQEPEGPYRWLRSSIRTAFDPVGPACDSVGGALLAAVTVNPELMAPVHAKYAEWTERIHSDSPDPMLAGLICMAMDGYYFGRMMGLKPCSREEEDRMRDFILSLLNKEDGAVS
jgi:Transcriptional regulator